MLIPIPPNQTSTDRARANVLIGLVLDSTGHDLPASDYRDVVELFANFDPEHMQLIRNFMVRKIQVNLGLPPDPIPQAHF